MRALESRIHDKKEPTKVEKVLGDPYDDVFDAVRYAVYSYHEAQVKPYGMRVAERLKKAIEVDPTRAVVDYNKILREEKNEEEPQQYSARWTAEKDERARTGRLFKMIAQNVGTLCWKKRNLSEGSRLAVKS